MFLTRVSPILHLLSAAQPAQCTAKLASRALQQEGQAYSVAVSGLSCAFQNSELRRMKLCYRAWTCLGGAQAEACQCPAVMMSKHELTQYLGRVSADVCSVTPAVASQLHVLLLPQGWQP